MIQTPFQITSNRPIKFKINTENSPTYFLSNSLRLKNEYKISEIDTLENFNAVFEEEASGWFQVNRENEQNWEHFSNDLKQTYLNERYSEIVKSKIKFSYQKKGEDIYAFITEI